ncbi:MAG: hypothetical protein R3D59_01780 [Paracoccaceae bacterium]
MTPAKADLDAGRAAVAEKLPYYCMPGLILPMDDLPRTARGKLDKRLLLEMAQEHIATSHVEAQQ